MPLEIAFNISKEKVAFYKDLFDKYDVDKSGQLDIAELQQMLNSQNMKMDQQEILELINDYDKDASGSIDFEEFLNIFVQNMKSSDSSKVEGSGNTSDDMEAPAANILDGKRGSSDASYRFTSGDSKDAIPLDESLIMAKENEGFKVKIDTPFGKIFKLSRGISRKKLDDHIKENSYNIA